MKQKTGAFDKGAGISEREIDLVKTKGESLGKRIRMGIDGEKILKAVVAASLLIFFALLQTTIFARFRPFGAVPDLMLPLVIAVAMTEREKFGAIFGLFAAFVIEALGGATMFVLPLLYMPAGYICGILAVHYFRDTFLVRALFTAAACAAHIFFTLFVLLSTVGGIGFGPALTKAAFPEFLSSLVFSPLPHLAAYMALKLFHRPREEKVSE